LDLSRRICFSKRYLRSSDATHILFRRGNVVEITEDDVKVDCFSLEDVFPFGLWEALRCRCCSTNLSFGKVEVLLKNGKGLSGLLTIFVDLLGFSGDLSGVPG
jgi:hypothetical protein